MRCLWKIVRTLLGVAGAVLIFGAVGTSDYYVMQLGQPEPSNVGTIITIGLAMMMPMIIHAIYKTVKEYER